MVKKFFLPTVLGFFGDFVVNFYFCATRPFGLCSSCRDTSKTEEFWVQATSGLSVGGDKPIDLDP